MKSLRIVIKPTNLGSQILNEFSHGSLLDVPSLTHRSFSHSGLENLSLQFFLSNIRQTGQIHS
jgi:hypothetical protein